jgi:uncharacterized protein involved in outer membrane biogenesis
MMKRSFRLSQLGRRTRILLASVLALAALALLFDWNWLRPALVRYLIDKSSREVRIQDLHVDLGLEPTIRLRGVHIENAPWAAKRPFATAGEVSFTVSLKSLWQRRPVISKLVLIDADVDMERQANGLRNWRLRHPEDRSPGKVKIQTLEAHRSQIRFVNGGIDLDFTAIATPLEKESAQSRSGALGRNKDETHHEPAIEAASRRGVRDSNDALSTRIAFKGTYEGVTFTGEALSAGIISFRESGVSFPLRGHIASRKTRFDFDGFFTDVFDLGPIDAKVRVAGPTLTYVYPFLRLDPPHSRSFEFDAQLTQTHDQYKFSQLRGRIGDTDVAGEATYDRSRERPLVLAALRSEKADIADLSALVGLHNAPHTPANRPTKDSTPEAQQQAARADAAASRADRIFPARPFHVDRLKAVDAHINLNAKKLTADSIPMLESLRLSADLKDGMLELKPVDVGFAGGHLAGSISFNGGREPPAARATIELRDIRLEKLVPALAATARSIAPVRGEIALSGYGNSIATIFGNATGSATARMDGGRISNLADAKLGLNGGKVLSLLVRGDRDVGVHCGAVALDVRNGSGKWQVVLDTEQTRADGVGTVTLPNERWDLVLTPQPKNPGLLTRRASIRAEGTLKTAAVSIQERVVIGSMRGAAPSADSASSSDTPCVAVRAIAVRENRGAKPSRNDRAAR